MKPNKPTQEICTKHPKAWGCVRGKDHDGACSNIPPQPTVGEQTDVYDVCARCKGTGHTKENSFANRGTKIQRDCYLCKGRGNMLKSSDELAERLQEALTEIQRLKSPTPIPVGEQADREEPMSLEKMVEYTNEYLDNALDLLDGGAVRSTQYAIEQAISALDDIRRFYAEAKN